MAQKNKVQAKARGSKPAASAAKAAARPSSATSAAKSKAAAKKPAAKVTTTKTVVTRQISKGHDMKKAGAVAATASKKIAVKPAAAAPAASTAPRAPVQAAAATAKAAPARQAAPVPAAAAPAGMTSVSPARAAAALAKSSGQKLTAPVQPAASNGVPLSPKAIAEKAAVARQQAMAVAAQQAAAAAQVQKKPVSQRHGFKTSEFIVYPAHGVGRIVGIEEQEIAGMSLELFVITFDKEKLTLRVPTGKLESVGMRKLADEGVVKKAMETLKGRARVKRTMWSRRAQEYVAKINSGDLVSIAEVVRDLYRSEAQPEQSYSERQLYEDALDRMAREIAAVDKLDERGAVQRITEVLSKSARGRRIADGTETEGEIKAA